MGAGTVPVPLLTVAACSASAGRGWRGSGAQHLVHPKWLSANSVAFFRLLRG